MASRAIAVANNVVTALNSHAFAQTFTAERFIIPTLSLEGMSGLKVLVVPSAKQELPEDRQYDAMLNIVQVGVMKRLSTIDNSSIDPMLDLVEEINDFLKRLNMAGGGQWVGTDNSPLWDEEHLKSLSQFTSILKISYRGLAE